MSTTIKVSIYFRSFGVTVIKAINPVAGQHLVVESVFMFIMCPVAWKPKDDFQNKTIKH